MLAGQIGVHGLRAVQLVVVALGSDCALVMVDLLAILIVVEVTNSLKIATPK